MNVDATARCGGRRPLLLGAAPAVACAQAGRGADPLTLAGAGRTDRAASAIARRGGARPYDAGRPRRPGHSRQAAEPRAANCPRLIAGWAAAAGYLGLRLSRHTA